MADTREALLVELTVNGIKHSPDEVLAIGRDWTGRVAWVESGEGGNGRSGMAHIVSRHAHEFADHGITLEEVPQLLVDTLSRGKIIGYRRKPQVGLPDPRPVFVWERNGARDYLAITVGRNGFII